MCGIYCSIKLRSDARCSNQTRDLLEARGPDSIKDLSWSEDIASEQDLEPSKVNIRVLSTVLALRGSSIEPQPLQPESCKSCLCWNGEAWKHQGQVISGNDARYVFNLLFDANSSITTSSTQRVFDALTNITGPFAFVFYDAGSRQLFYGKDSIGRRSLLSQILPEGGIIICSLADVSESRDWEEVEVGGLHVVNLAGPSSTKQYFPWPTHHRCVNSDLPQGQVPALTSASTSVNELEQQLRDSLRLRVADVPNLGLAIKDWTRNDARIGVLFSGGLDCTVLARMAHDQIPIDEPIDLLNVAFENPRSMSAISKLDQDISVYENCPDRKTARSSFSELLRVCGGRRWRLIAIDVPFSDVQSHRDTIVRLMAPHNTEMDLSISMALYFAARGTGRSTDGSSGQFQAYRTKARVLLSGLGADELFAGYTRHATASVRGGLQALIKELDLDVQRLGHRNLGRDDRVTSHWGREVRYPYLDEDLMTWALRLPVWEKCSLGLPHTEALENRGHVETTEDTLDPAKKILRLLAWRLELRQAANEKKRAIQFGARTAKMHVGKGRVKGTDLII